MHKPSCPSQPAFPPNITLTLPLMFLVTCILYAEPWVRSAEVEAPGRGGCRGLFHAVLAPRPSLVSQRRVLGTNRVRLIGVAFAASFGRRCGGALAGRAGLDARTCLFLLL